MGLLICAPLTFAQQTVVLASEASLQQAIEQALHYYPSITSAEQQRAAQQAATEQAFARHWPTLGVEGNSGWYQDSRYEQDDGAGVLARVPVYSGGRISADVRMQEALLAKSDEHIILARDDVVLQASSAYLSWYRALRSVQLAQENVAMIDGIVGDVREVAAADFGRQADLDQAVVRQAKARQELERQQAGLRQAEALYQRYIGEPPDGEGTLVDARIGELLPSTLPDALQRIEFSHPAIVAAQAQARAAEENIALSKASLRPDVSLELRSRNGGSAVLNMTWIGFDMAAQHGVSAASASALAAQSSVADVRLQVIEAVRQRWAELESAQARQVWAQTQVEIGEKVLLAYRDQFLIGRRSLLDLLNSSDEVYNNRVSALTTNLEWHYARYQVAAAIGHLAVRY